jgi:hypothetical protein
MSTTAAAPDYLLTCRHCGQRFVEMVALLFHTCSGQPSQPAQRPQWPRRKIRKPKKWAEANRG